MQSVFATDVYHFTIHTTKELSSESRFYTSITQNEETGCNTFGPGNPGLPSGPGSPILPYQINKYCKRSKTLTNTSLVHGVAG